MRRITAILLVLLFSVGIFGGCANIEHDGTRTKTEGTLIGAGAGAALGAGLGALLGGSDGALLGAGIGALLGGVSGYAYGSHVAEQKEKYASEEEWLDACIVQAQEINQETIAYIAELKDDIAVLDKQTTALAAEYKLNKASKSYVTAEAKKIATKEKEIIQNIATLEREVASQKIAVADAKTTGKTAEADILDKEIALTQKSIEELKAYQEQMASISARVAV